jgi:hypothetical protein
MGRRARRYREQSEIMPGWKEIRSIADVAQPRPPLYAVGRDERLDGPCSILFRLARLALAHSPRAIRFPRPRADQTGCEALLGQTGRNPAFIVTLGTAIPLPKRIASPVTEFGSSRLTELLIRLEDKLGLIGSRCGLAREGRGRHQRDQRESSDERFHDASPGLRAIVRRWPEHRSRRRYCWIYVIALRFRLRGIAAKWSADRSTARHWIVIGRRCRRNSPTAPP